MVTLSYLPSLEPVKVIEDPASKTKKMLVGWLSRKSHLLSNMQT